MLASPLMPGTAPTAVIFSPSHPTDEALQYRPAKDLESFNKLLPPPIEFVEGSSSGTLLVAEGKYEPINVSPKSQKSEVSIFSSFFSVRARRLRGHLSYLKSPKRSIPPRMVTQVQ
jgi:hypothetical protein